MAKKFPLLLVVILVVAVGFVLYEAGLFNDLLAGPAPAPGGNSYRIAVVPGSVSAVGGSPNVVVGASSTSISGSQATMGATTSVSLKLTVSHLSGSGARAFDLTLANPQYVSSGGGTYTLYDKDSSGCPTITMSVDSGGTGTKSCGTFHGTIDVNGGTMTISVTFTMQEQLWQAGGGNPPVGFQLDGLVSASGAMDYHITYTRSS